jgi:glutamine phosphoribosylpyrophosphate amidotransferase
VDAIQAMAACATIAAMTRTTEPRRAPARTRSRSMAGLQPDRRRSRKPYDAAGMCEHYVARSSEPFRLDELWPFTDRLERFGIAGFGWGAAWLDADGSLRTHRDLRAFRDDPGREAIGAIETTSVLVHLRRPSKLSTLTLADTQPFDDPAGRFAFSHNGDLRETRALRERYRGEGRIRGRADTEVGARWLEDRWATEPRASAPALLAELHRCFGGQANLAVIESGGAAHHYAGNTENPVYTFRLGRIGIAATAIYSIDRSLFQLAAPGATHRRVVRPGTAVSLAPDGDAIVAS